MKFHLRCIACNTKDIRDAKECKGNDNPLCQKCLGPMILEKAIGKEK